MTRELKIFIVSLIIAEYFVLLYIGHGIESKLFATLFLTFIIYEYYQINKNSYDITAYTKPGIIFIGSLILLQAAWPLFSPKIAFSYGDTIFGTVKNYETYTNQILFLEVTPPLFPVNFYGSDFLPITDCQKNIVVGRNVSNAVPQQYSPLLIFQDSNSSITVCTFGVDGWKVNKITLPIYFTSAQPLSYSPNYMEEIYYIDNNPVVNETDAFETNSIFFDNYENFPLIITKSFVVKNGTLAWSRLEETECYTFVYRNDTNSQPNYVHKISSNETAIIFGDITAYLNPREHNKRIYVYMKC